MAPPYFYVSLAFGGPLTCLGLYLCLRWWVFWKRNYKEELLINGPYARVRHPLYSAFLLLAVGLAVLFPVLETVMLAVISVVVILFYVKREEEALIARYGKAYREYMVRVPWKLVPKMY